MATPPWRRILAVDKDAHDVGKEMVCCVISMEFEPRVMSVSLSANTVTDSPPMLNSGQRNKSSSAKVSDTAGKKSNVSSTWCRCETGSDGSFVVTVTNCEAQSLLSVSMAGEILSTR